jgi:hypothetical protein
MGESNWKNQASTNKDRPLEMIELVHINCTASAHSCAGWVLWRDGDRLDILESVATIS